MTTIHEFLRRFPDEEACIKELIKLRSDKCCGKLYRVKSRYALVCGCGKQISLKRGTIFEDSSTKLWNWFYAMFRLSGLPGVSAKQIQRELGVTYKCAFRMLHKIRKVMGERMVLEGTVEVDEAYIGGKKKVWAENNSSAVFYKDSVLGLVERDGRIKTIHIPSPHDYFLLRGVGENVKVGSTVYTDGKSTYRLLPAIGYKHDFVNHSSEYAKGKVHTNTLESYWAKLKNGLSGTYFGVSSQHLSKYLSEFAFRYNHSDPFADLVLRLA